MNYRIIALDVDGTLLNDEHRVTERTMNTLHRVRAAGAEIVLCTGRSPLNTLPLMEELGLDGTVITHNGAVTVRTRDRQMLHQCAFSTEDVEPYLNYCRERDDINFDLCTAFQLYVEKLPLYAEEMYRQFGLAPTKAADVTAKAPFVKMSVYGRNSEAIEQFQHHWEERTTALTTIRSADQFVDVMHPEATKGNALRRLADDWGVPRERILAIGNYFNDQAMIEFAGMGIAVANSPEGLKAVADRVTLSNNEDGVHVALLEHCFGE